MNRPLSGLLSILSLLAFPLAARSWVTAYYPGGSENVMPVSAIDFSCVTHVIHFALEPDPDGSLNAAVNHLSPAAASNLITRAHGAGRKAVVCVGGAGSGPGFQGASAPAHLSSFISNIVNVVSVWGYDGVDVDWEPLPASDFPAFTTLVRSLRTALDASGPRPLLFIAASAYPVYGDPPGSEYAMCAALQDQLDQINIMTYDLSGPYDGWMTWFNSPLYDGGSRFASTGAVAPSINGAVQGFLAHGVSPGKIGIGVPFYGDVWTGSVWAPRQQWSVAPFVESLPYSTIMAEYYRTNRYHWDAGAGAAYLSIRTPRGGGGRFISFDDERACQEKVRYARDHSLGGLMIWQLAHDYFPTHPPGRRDPLLRAIKDALQAPLPLHKAQAINIIPPCDSN